jgi:hypothetical protein
MSGFISMLMPSGRWNLSLFRPNTDRWSMGAFFLHACNQLRQQSAPRARGPTVSPRQARLPLQLPLPDQSGLSIRFT